MYLRGKNTHLNSNQNWFPFELPFDQTYLAGGILAGMAISLASNSFPIPKYPLSINNIISVGSTFMVTQYFGNAHNDKSALVVGEFLGISILNTAYPELRTIILDSLDTTLTGLLDTLLEDIYDG